MKKILAITLVIILALAFSSSVLAASVALPKDGDQDNGGMIEWQTDGTDNNARPLTGEVLKQSTGIVFATDIDPATIEGGFNAVVFGGYNGWSWTEYNELVYTYADGKITVMWAANGIDLSGVGVGDAGDASHVKFIFGAWGVDWADRGITSVYLIGLPDDVPGTGVFTFIGLAVGTLAVSGTGAALITRKLKKK